jgi:hypothetical protein
MYRMVIEADLATHDFGVASDVATAARRRVKEVTNGDVEIANIHNSSSSATADPYRLVIVTNLTTEDFGVVSELAKNAQRAVVEIAAAAGCESARIQSVTDVTRAYNRVRMAQVA